LRAVFEQLILAVLGLDVKPSEFIAWKIPHSLDQKYYLLKVLVRAVRDQAVTQYDIRRNATG
jgi:hypothetical protein